jgi:GMP synthase-like glutamine amidotransferase
MILIINICNEQFHYLEFVRPIEQILQKANINFTTKHYTELDDIESFSKIIICGTSLKDNEFRQNLSKFKFLKDYKKPILGICAGFQIISKLLKNKTTKNQEIGTIELNFEKEFLGLKNKNKVYSLHNNSTTQGNLEVFAKSENSIQAVKHENFYGVLFHPEVYNPELILNFAQL